MPTNQGAHWHCSNRGCGWYAVLVFYTHGSAVPPCACGSPLKQSDYPMRFSYLDFLRREEPSSATPEQDEE